MDKQKQIEEMYQEFLNYKFEKSCPETFSYKGLFEYLYTAGYRKIPENAVVVSKAEYNDLKGLEKYFDDYLIKEITEARKETAEKFAKMLKEWVKEAELGAYIEVESKVINGVIDEIAKEIMGEKQ